MAELAEAVEAQEGWVEQGEGMEALVALAVGALGGVESGSPTPTEGGQAVGVGAEAGRAMRLEVRVEVGGAEMEVAAMATVGVEKALEEAEGGKA